ncbi:SPG7 matrix AAA peptidase subunit, paraplegin [Dermatophagoides farinae]|uniref:SPG7 matrix AAA peptidase subunit, paraplegin n=1 Tax=Dermatophagoides farinae TaxID=6954 RepID=UPI003F625B47
MLHHLVLLSRQQSAMDRILAITAKILQSKRNQNFYAVIHSMKFIDSNFNGQQQRQKQIHQELNAWKRVLWPESIKLLNNLQKSLIRYNDGNRQSNKSGRQQSSGDNNRNSSSNNNNDKDDPNRDDKKLMAYGLVWMALGYTIITFVSLMFPPSNKPDVLRFVSWNEFYYQMLSKGEVELIVVKPDLDLVTIYLHEDAIIRGKKAPFRQYHMNIVDVKKFEARLREAEARLGIKPDQSVQIIYERNQENVWFALFSLLVFGAIVSMFMRNSSKSQMIGTNMFSNLRRAKFTIVDPLIGDGKGVRFNDVAGLKEAKVEIMEFVDYLKSPERFKMLGAKIPKGVLLLGPPGCGKTMLAKAVATEASVPFLAINGSEFIEMIGGLGAARVRDLFTEARKRSPCIVYIDEIDAIGRKRSGERIAGGGSSGEEEQTLNQLLVEMDGMSQRDEIIMLASTNRADILDRALLRPGRFDRHILIDYPTLEERKEIFISHFKSIKSEKEPKFYATRMAQLTPGFSGADIANVCNEAALHAARVDKKLVQSDDLEIAIERVVGGPEKRTDVMGPQEKRIIAFHECGHALVGWLLPNTDALLKISIVPRTTNALGFSRYLPSDRKLYTQQELYERMCMALGGRVAEALTFNHVSSGAQDDLNKVTKLAYTKIQVYGMDPLVGNVSFDYEENKFGRKPFSRKLARLIDERARLLVAQAYKDTEKLVQDNRDKLKLMAEELLKQEVLNYTDIERLIGEPPYGKKNLVEQLDLNSLIDTTSGGGGGDDDGTSATNQNDEKSENQMPPSSSSPSSSSSSESDPTSSSSNST